MSSTLNQIVNLYKPSGPTSFAMVHSVKKMLGVKKAGHIGTLDPMAEGILPICLNQSTRIIQFLSSLSKHYQCTMTLGAATDTQDSTGKAIFEGDPSKTTENQIKEVLASFVGEQKQLPPMYSAKKNKGIPLYKYARNGINIERKPVTVNFYSIDFINMNENRVEFSAHCSAGTYIRTLCHDIGQKIGCGAHMSGLIRKQVGVFDQESSVSPERLKVASTNGELDGVLFPVEKVLGFLPEIRISDDFVKPLGNGNAIPKFSLLAYPGEFEPGMNIRVCNGSDKVLAIVEPLVDQDGLEQLGPNDIAFKLKRVLI
jgi:tRNA pseudouridine55 synthase